MINEDSSLAAKQRDLVLAYKQAFGDYAGKAVLEDLQKRFGAIGNMSKDANEAFFKEGRHSVIQWILWHVSMPVESLENRIEVQTE